MPDDNDHDVEAVDMGGWIWVGKKHWESIESSLGNATYKSFRVLNRRAGMLQTAGRTVPVAAMSPGNATVGKIRVGIPPPASAEAVCEVGSLSNLTVAASRTGHLWRNVVAKCPH